MVANVTKHCPPSGMDGESNGENVGENVIHSSCKLQARMCHHAAVKWPMQVQYWRSHRIVGCEDDPPPSTSRPSGNVLSFRD